MAIAALQSTSLVGFTLPGTFYSVRMARFYVRATLGYHGLGDYVGDVETVTSELVSNAVMHAGARPLGVQLLRLDKDPDALAVVVTDSCPLPPARLDPAEDFEHGRGLLVVEALSAHWGWTPHDPGKAVFAIFIRQS